MTEQEMKQFKEIIAIEVQQTFKPIIDEAFLPINERLDAIDKNFDRIDELLADIKKNTKATRESVTKLSSWQQK